MDIELVTTTVKLTKSIVRQLPVCTNFLEIMRAREILGFVHIGYDLLLIRTHDGTVKTFYKNWHLHRGKPATRVGTKVLVFTRVNDVDSFMAYMGRIECPQIFI